MNLPHALRYKEENIILAGIIPGPHEPHLNINSYINPLVDELLELWIGIEMDTTAGRKLVRCAVICASCDIQAGRKLCGFLGHTARYGCTKCKKVNLAVLVRWITPVMTGETGNTEQMSHIDKMFQRIQIYSDYLILMLPECWS